MTLAFTLALFEIATAQKAIFKTGVDNVKLILDGQTVEGGWRVSPQLNPDILETAAHEIVFISDIDSLTINLNEWESINFDMLTQHGDTARVMVTRSAKNQFDNPNPALLKVAPSGNLSRKQAEFDIDALVYGLSQVHPDIFSVCRQEDFFRAVNKAKTSLPDSVSNMELYRLTAPIVAMIGDGHTCLGVPFNTVFTEKLERLPVFVNVLTDRSIICTSSLDSIIPKGSKILSINGVKSDDMLDSMMPFVSGERPHFKLSRIDGSFPGLFHMLYNAKQYEVKYLPKNSKKPLIHTFPAVTWSEIKKRCPSTRNRKRHENYSFSIDKANNVAIMDFREFSNIPKMEHFADSMFAALRDNNIGNLIIDLRNNGGGNSRVGDILLRYISPEPFVQMDKSLVKITPLTSRLMGNNEVQLMFQFHEADSTGYIQPLSPEEGHYTGTVYLLTSNKTFSSAGSFAWAFKECGMGTVIGEETGGMNVCYGDILMYPMPVSRMNTSISFKRFWQLRADENDIHGTIPDIAVPASDAMDAAMKLVRKNSSL